MSEESPFIECVEVERPLEAERDDMWDHLVDLCATEADLAALLALYDEATTSTDLGR